MTSKPSGTPTSDGIEEVISAHGKSLGDGGAAPTDLEDRLDKLEVLIEEMGRTSTLVSSFSEYVTDLKADLNALRRTRFWMLMLAIAFVVGTDLTVLYMVLAHGQWFAHQDTYFKSIMFIGTLTASVVLISIMLKGAFHSLAERNKDDGGLPPHLKEGVEAVKMIIGK